MARHGRHASTIGFALAAAVAAALLPQPTAAQSRAMPVRPSPPPPILGTWRGMSICTPEAPATCGDEEVLYRIETEMMPDASLMPGRHRVTVAGDKIVDGKQVRSGTLSCEYLADRQEINCPLREFVWVFRLEGEQVVGTLTHRSGVLWRKIATRRIGGIGM